MASIHSLLAALDERTIAQRIGIANDETRMRYPLRSNTVRSFDEFSNVIGDYYNYHFTSCVSGGGSLSRAEAAGRAKEILEREYRRQSGGDIVGAFNDAHDRIRGAIHPRHLRSPCCSKRLGPEGGAAQELCGKLRRSPRFLDSCRPT